MTYRRTWIHSLHPSFFCALRVEGETDLMCPTRRGTATVDHLDQRMLQEHRDEVMSAAFIRARRGTLERKEGTAPRVRSAAVVGARRETRDICSVCNGVVEKRTYMRVACSCCWYLRCALSFVDEIGSWQNRIDNDHMPEPCLILRAPTLYIGSSRGPDTYHFERLEPGGQSGYDGKGRTRLFGEATTAQELVDLTRVATTRGEAEADAEEDGRSAFARQQHIRMP